MRVHASLILSCLLGLASAQAAEQSITLADMKVTVWSSESDDRGKQPVIVFSHGFHGCATQSRYLMQAFASAGYLVLAPNHRDAACHGGEAHWTDKAQKPFRQPEAWDEDSYRDRAEDIRKLIDAVATDARFSDRADLSRLGLVGHSLGGYTVLGLGGAWPSWRVTGVKALLALSPYCQPFLVQGTLAGLTAPVMYQGGTFDLGDTPALKKPMGAYDQSPEPKYYLELENAGHFAWTNLGHGSRDAIVAYSVGFMNHYVKGEPADPLMTQALPGVALLRYASDMGVSE